MKPILTFMGILLTVNIFAQQLSSQFLQSNSFLSHSSNTPIEYQEWIDDDNTYSSSAASSATDVILWSDDFANGLDGNNTSTVQTWTVSGTDSTLWEHDTDGSAGPFAGSTPETLDSETKDNGWMIFDADKGNINLLQSAFVKKHGELISPSIDLSNDTNVTLKFTHMYRYCCSPDHKLKVYVYDGTNWSNGIDVSIGSSVNSVKLTNEIELNITQYAGQKSDVKIKFSWEGDEAEAYYWMIDDVKIVKTNPYDANLLDAFYVTPTFLYGGTSYRIMNIDQAEQTTYVFVGSLQNSGYNNIDSSRIYANVVGENQSFQSHGLVSTPTSVDTLYTNQGFTPSATGVYNADIWGSDNDNQFITDTIRVGFEIDQYEYGKDNGNYNQGNFQRRVINDDGAYEIGNRFMIYKSQELGAVKIRMDAKTGSDAKGKIRLYEILSDGSNSYLAESQEENIGQTAGNWYNFKLDDPWDLSADVGYMVMLYTAAATSATDTAFISIGGIVNPQESFLVDVDGVGTGVDPNTWFYVTTAPCLRLNFEQQIGIKEQLGLAEFSLYPNPNNGVFSLKIKSKKQENLNLNVKNILGQIVYSENLNKVNQLTKQMNLTHLNSGIYTISLESEKGQNHSQKIIIK